MPRLPEPRGVCVVRVTREPTGLMLHVLSRLDVNDSSGQAEAIELDIERGLDLVRQFLEDFRRVNARK